MSKPAVAVAIRFGIKKTDFDLSIKNITGFFASCQSEGASNPPPSPDSFRHPAPLDHPGGNRRGAAVRW
jgi:hypothetical protein